MGIGDDAAVLDCPGDWYLLATVDMSVEGVHFRQEQIDATSLGRRALAVSMSDIAAMGGEPTSALVSLALPLDTSLELVDGILGGIQFEADRYGVVIVGGNLSRAVGGVAIDITVMGRVPKTELVLRSGAREGDAIVVTGHLGDAAAARLGNDLPPASEVGLYHFLQDMLVPAARLHEGRALAKLASIHAMMDVSDGLETDVQKLASASGLGVELYEDALPISDMARTIASRACVEVTGLALKGGEDYELLLTLSPDDVDMARESVGGTGATVIGRTVALDHGCSIVGLDGKRKSLSDTGWSHF